MADHREPPPVHPLPASVVLLFLAIAAVEAVLTLGAQGWIGGPQAVGWRLLAINDYAFFDEIFEQMWRLQVWPIEHLRRFVSYAFVHGSLTHAAFAGVILLAMGKMVAEALGQWQMLAIFFASVVAGALAYALLVDERLPLLGAFPGVYGLIGGFTYLLWRNLGALGENQYRAFTLIGFLMGIQLLFGLLFGGQKDWIADVAGFAVGFGLSFLLDRGGWSRLREKLRHD